MERNDSHRISKIVNYRFNSCHTKGDRNYGLYCDCSSELPGPGCRQRAVRRLCAAGQRRSVNRQLDAGALARGNSTIQAGTAIATFGSEGTYTNSTDGTSHAAIYMGQNDAGLQVWDQWKGQPVHQRTIRFQGGAPGVHPVNDGDAFYVID